MHIMTSPVSFINAPKNETMKGELHSCIICSSRTIRFLTSFLASTCIICRVVSISGDASQPKSLTFRAMMTLVAACCTLLTVPPLPAPSSLRTTRSSDRRSSRNSTPISRVSPRSTLLPSPPGICESPAEGVTFFGGAARARFRMFFLFIVLVLNALSAIVAAARSSRPRGTICVVATVERPGSAVAGVFSARGAGEVSRAMVQRRLSATAGRASRGSLDQEQRRRACIRLGLWWDRRSVYWVA
jgi:hypothetical protein